MALYYVCAFAGGAIGLGLTGAKAQTNSNKKLLAYVGAGIGIILLILAIIRIIV